MPFSRSRSPESMTRSATLSAWWAVKAPAWRSMASTSVVLPWSTWATIATLRRSVRRCFQAWRYGVAFGGEWGSRPTKGPDRVYGEPVVARARIVRSLGPLSRVGRMATIATTDRVDRDELLDFVRTRHQLTLITTRRDGRPQASPVTGGVDADGRIVVSTYPDRAKAVNLRRDPRGLGAGALRRVERRLRAGRRHRRGARHAEPGGRGRAGGVLPLHLRRAPRLGRVPRRRCARQGKSLIRITVDRVGPDRDRRLPAGPGAFLTLLWLSVPWCSLDPWHLGPAPSCRPTC